MDMRRAKQVEARQEGFTLLEVIVAISILTIGLLAVGSMQTAAIVANSKAYQVTESTVLAQSQLEELMRMPYASMAGGGPQQVGRYNVTWTVNAAAGVPNAMFITVTAQWTEKGVSRSTVLNCVRPDIF
jgi:type IV pilus modification protein PilV